MTSGGSGLAPAFTSATPGDGTTQAAVTGPVLLRANESVAWSNVGITYVDNAGDPGTWQAVAGGTGQTLTVPFTSTAPGLYIVPGTIGDGATTTVFSTSPLPAPSAIRIPISRVRWTTPYEITP